MQGKSGKNPELENACKIKVQISDKKSVSIILKNNDTFEVLLQKCSKELGIEESKMKFLFDGDVVDLEDTPETLDLDNEECFDLRVTE